MRWCGKIQQQRQGQAGYTRVMSLMPPPCSSSGHPSATTSGRRGMSIVELTLAIFVLSVGLLTVVGQINMLNSVRIQAEETVEANALLYALSERFQGSRWDTLGATTAPWSICRSEPNAGVAAPTRPLVDDSDLAAFDDDADGTVTTTEIATGRLNRGLQTLGLVAAPLRLINLRVYVEYYRAVAARDGDGNILAGSPGLMSGEDAGFTNDEIGDFSRALAFDTREENLPPADRANILANRLKYRLDPALPPGGQVGENEPVVIRLLATWSARVGDRVLPIGQLSIITCRKP
jgi:hypothetical protein